MIERQWNVRRILMKQIELSGIEYYYFLTADYYFNQKDYNGVIKDNHRLRKILRKFFKSDLHVIIVIEKHTDEDSPHYLGYHRHLILERIPDERWKDPTNSMMNFMLNLNEEAAFGMKMGQVPPVEIQNKFIAKVCRDLNQSTPSGYVGTDVTEIKESKGRVWGLVKYMTKQVDLFHPAYEVIDPSSDIDFTPIMDLYDDNKTGARSQIVFA